MDSPARFERRMSWALVETTVLADFETHMSDAEEAFLMNSQRIMARVCRWMPAILLAVMGLANCCGVEAAGYTWTGSGTNALWGTPGNWVGGSAPVSNTSSTTLVFTGTTQTSSTNGTALFGVSQLRFANPPQTVTKTFSWSGVGYESTPYQNQSFTGTGSFTYNPALAVGGTVSASGTSAANNNGLVDLSISFRNVTTGATLGSYVDASGGVVSYSSLQFQYATLANTFLGAFNMGGATYLTGTASGPGVYGSLENPSVSPDGIAESVGSGLVVSGSGIASSIAPFTLSGSSVQFGAGGSIVTESPVGYASLTDTIALAVVTTSGVLDVTLGGTAGGVRNLAISGVVSGSAGLSLSSTSSSAGLLTLSGNNTYSGVTTVGSGTLQVGAGGTTGSIAGDIVDNATLVFNRSDALTSAGSISGSGSVLKLGAGVLSLTGTNTLSGLTTVTAGTLSVGAGGTTGSITGNIVDNSTLVFNRSNALTYAGSISGSGAVVKQGSGVLTLTGSSSYSGLTTVAGGALNIQNSAALGSSAAGAVVSTGAALELQGGLSVAAESLLLSGSGVSGGGALRNISGTNTYSGAVTLAANSRINSDAGRLVLNSGTIAGTGYALTVGGAGDTAISSSINTGAGGITKDGSGRLTLTGSSSYTGLTRVNAGVLNVQNSFALGGTTAGTLVDASATLELQGGISVTGEALVINGSGVNGGGALRSVSGTNTFAGPITLGNDSRINSDAGLLILTSSTIGSSSNGLGLTVGGAGDTAISSSINTGAGGITKDGSGRLTLTGSSSYTGLTRVNAGVLNVQNSFALGGTTAGTLVDASATLELQGGISVTGEALVINGSGVNGGGALRSVSGTNTFAGPITLGNDSRINSDAGLLILTSSTIGSSSNGLGLTVGGAGDTAIGSSILLGAGGLTKDGSGTLRVSGTSTYTGATVVSSGDLIVTGQLGNTNVTVGGGARLAGDGTILGGVTIADSGTLSVGSLGGSPYGDLAVGSLMLGGSASTATTIMDIQGSGNQAGTAGINYDSLVVSNPGGLTYGGTLGLNFWNTQTFSDWTVFHLFDFTGTAHEDFESVTSLAAVGNVYGGLIFNGPGVSGAWTAEVGNGQSLVFYEATGSLVVVPEPSTILGAVVGIGMAAWRYRRQRHLKRVKQATLAA